MSSDRKSSRASLTDGASLDDSADSTFQEDVEGIEKILVDQCMDWGGSPGTHAFQEIFQYVFMTLKF